MRPRSTYQNMLLIIRCRAGSSGHFDIIYVAVAQFFIKNLRWNLSDGIGTQNLSYKSLKLRNYDGDHKRTAGSRIVF